MSEKRINIGEASKIMGVSIDTLRRWDKSGKLTAQRNTGVGYRYYNFDTVKFLSNDLKNTSVVKVSDKTIPRSPR